MIQNDKELQEILADVTFREGTILDGLSIETGVLGPGFFLRVKLKTTDVLTEAPVTWPGRQWPVARDAKKGEVIRTAAAAVLMFIEHEAREGIQYRGMPIYEPHWNPEALHKLRSVPGAVEG